MAQRTITLTPTSWTVRTEPGVRLSWAPTIGSADMLAAQDSDIAVCQNASGVAVDSHSLDAKGFRTAGGSLPVFEGDARNPSLKIRCRMSTGDGQTAAPYLYVFDTANLGGVEAFGPFDTVNAAAWYERISHWPDEPGNNVFSTLAAGRFATSCIFPSRPADAAQASIHFKWDAVALELSYTYGPNTTPTAFNFKDAAGAIGTQVLSSVVVIAGIDTPQLASIAGDASAVFSVAGDAFSAAPRNIAAGQTLQLRMTAPGVVGAFVDCVVTVETRTDAWRVTAGTDIPTNLNAPANLVNCIPGWIVPDAGVTAGQTFAYAPRGNTIPMPFSLEWGAGVSDVQWSTAGAGGPWSDGALAGLLPVNSNISIRCRAPSGSGVSGFVRLHYTSADLTDDTTITTGAPGFVYKVDLSPVDALEATAPGATRHWSPAPAGAMHHASVAASSVAGGVAFSTVNSYINAGRSWRRADTSVMPWPPGAVLKGVDYGGLRTQSYPLAVADAVTSIFYALNPAGATWLALAGSDQALTLNQTVYLNGGASPGITPAGWTLGALLEALKADTFRLGRRTTFKDGSNGHQGSATVRSHSLRIFFEVVKPPEGATWEI